MLTALMLSAAMVASVSSCRLGGARYVLHGSPGVTAILEPRTPTEDFGSNIVIRVHSEKAGSTYSFVPFEEGNGAGVHTHLALMQSNEQPSEQAASNALGTDTKYLVTGPNYVFKQNFAPKLDAAAPSHIFMPGLAFLFWYGDFNHRDSVPIAFLDLQGCGG